MGREARTAVEAPAPGPVTLPVARHYDGAHVHLAQYTTVTRTTCAGTTQEPTLSASGFGDLPEHDLEEMTVHELFGMSLADRLAWYRSKLCRYQDQLFESARNNFVPPPLLAVVILNELADIDSSDRMQDALDVIIASVGPAQIEVSATAIPFGLVDIPPDLSRGPLQLMATDAQVRASYVCRRLQVMQVAIEAAAREIRRLLTLMNGHLTGVWQTEHAFTGPAPASGNPWDFYYDRVRGPAAYESATAPAEVHVGRVRALTDLVVAAYNSPDIVIALGPGSSLLFGGHATGAYAGGRAHGSNAATIAEDVERAHLFEP